MEKSLNIWWPSLISDIVTNRSIMMQKQFVRKVFILALTINFDPVFVFLVFVQNLNLKDLAIFHEFKWGNYNIYQYKIMNLER